MDPGTRVPNSSQCTPFISYLWGFLVELRGTIYGGRDQTGVSCVQGWCPALDLWLLHTPSRSLLGQAWRVRELGNPPLAMVTPTPSWDVLYRAVSGP